MKGYVILLTAIVVIAMNSCQKEQKEQQEELSLTVTPTVMMLYREGTTQITTNAQNPTFSSQDEFYASVDQYGWVTANKVGSTFIDVSGNGKTQPIPILIIPRYTLYPELDQLIGKTKSDVTAMLGESYVGDGDKWTYRNLTRYAELIVVTFSDEKVEGVGAVISTQYVSQLADYLIERYTIIGMENDMYYFYNHDKNVAIAMTIYSISALFVLYVAPPDSKATDNDTLSVDSDTKQYDQKNQIKVAIETIIESETHNKLAPSHEDSPVLINRLQKYTKRMLL